MNILIPVSESFLRRADAVHSPRVAKAQGAPVLADGQPALTATGLPAVKRAMLRPARPMSPMRADDAVRFGGVLHAWQNAARREGEFHAAKRYAPKSHQRAIAAEVAGLKVKAEVWTQALRERFRNSPAWLHYIDACCNICKFRANPIAADCFVSRR